MCDLNKPLFQCTLGEFAEAIVLYQNKYQRSEPKETFTNMPKGMKGIMEIFGCAEYTARKIKQSGVIDDAIYQLGSRVFVTDPDKAKQLYKKLNQKNYGCNI